VEDVLAQSPHTTQRELKINRSVSLRLPTRNSEETKTRGAEPSFQQIRNSSFYALFKKHPHQTSRRVAGCGVLSECTRRLLATPAPPRIFLHQLPLDPSNVSCNTGSSALAAVVNHGQ